MNSIDLKIEGIECVNCARRLESALSRLPGVQKASISRGNPAEVVYDPNAVSLEDIRTLIEDAGFSVPPS